jgi:hypothetical protein
MDIDLSTYKTSMFLVLLVLVLCPVAAVDATTVPEFRGAYKENLVWQDEVTMAGDVLILPGGSLVIRAGTRINVVPAEGTKIDPEYLSSYTELLVRGRLEIQGTAKAPVRFIILDSGSVDDISWAGITLDSAAESSIRHAEIERADVGILTVGSSPYIANNHIRSSRYGIIAQQNSHPRILGNTLDNGEGGIFCWEFSNPVIKDNRISGHDEEALFVDATSRPQLGANLIAGNAIGLALYPRDLTHDMVQLKDNRDALRWLGQQGQAGGLP